MSAINPASVRDPNEDLAGLLALSILPDGRLASRQVAANHNARVFGGQILAQTVAAAAQGLEQRHTTALQLLFLQGALPDQSIHYEVSTLQSGRRMTSRHVQARQQDRLIASAHVSFQTAEAGFEHQIDMPADLPPPEELRTLDELDRLIAETLPAGPYALQQKLSMDLRLIDPQAYLFTSSGAPRMRYWLRARHPLPDDPAVHAAALAFLSDYWLCSTSLCMHTPMVGARGGLYVASLNHSMWLHQPCRADEWLLFDVQSPRAHGGRGLNQAHVFRRSGELVATVAQEITGGRRQE